MPTRDETKQPALVGKRVAAVRKTKLITQSDLAARAKISLRHLQGIEAGRADAKISVIERIGEVLGVEPFQLFIRPGLDHAPREDGLMPTANRQACPELCPQEFTRITCPLDGMGIPLQLCDENGLIWYVTSQCAELQGYSRREVCGKMHIWDFIADEDEKAGLQRYLRFLVEHKPKPTPYVSSNRAKDGRVIPIRLDWSYLLDANGRVAGFSTVIHRRG